MKLKKPEAGFTLIELLVVIGIIVLLAGLIFPQIMRAKGKGMVVQCLNNLRQLGMASTEYIEDDETHLFPWAGDGATATDHLNLLVSEDYIKESKMFICPAAKGKVKATEEDDGSFTLERRNNAYAWSSVPLSESDDPDTPLGSDGAVKDGDGDNNHADGMNVLRVDGAVVWKKMRKDEEKKLPEDLVAP